MECSFCHGANSDESRFCSTCGRRIPTAPVSTSQHNVGERNVTGERAPLGRLHSPLLSGGYEDDLEDDVTPYPKPRQMERLGPSLLRHSSPNSSLPPTAPASAPASSSPTHNIDNRAGRLRSPLLESSSQPEFPDIPEITPRQEEYEALRSPLLSAPILFNQAPSNTSPNTPASAPAPTSLSASLNTSLKTPLDTSSPIPAAPSIKNAPIITPVTPPTPPAPASKTQYPESSSAPDISSVSVVSTSSKSSATPISSISPSAAAPITTPPPPPGGTTTPSSSTTPPLSTAESGTTSATQTTSKPAVAKTPLLLAASSTSTPAAPAAPAASQHRTHISSALQKQYGLDESDSETTSPSSSTTSQPSANKPYAVLILLAIAAVLKIWFINQYWGQQVIVVDQIAQLLVIVSVAGLCLQSSSTKPVNKQK